MSAHNPRYDVIVVGVGGIGSSAAYHLAARGKSVLGIEKFDVPHSNGSSHGSTRLIGPIQRVDPIYLPLIERAFELWRDLEAASGKRLLYQTGIVRGWESADEEGHRGALDAATRFCDSHGIQYEAWSADDVREAFPGFDLPGRYEALYQPESGFLNPEACVRAHVARATELGATIRTGESVQSWKRIDDGIQVRTDRGTYDADRVVVAAGAWSGRLIEDLTDALMPQPRVVSWFEPEDPPWFSTSTFPSFSFETTDGYYYGTPIYERGGIKVGRRPTAPRSIDPDDLSSYPTDDERAALRRFAERHFRGSIASTVEVERCIVTESTDNHFVVDSHPDAPELIVAAGFTGSGFMMASSLGELVADHIDGDERSRIDQFGLSRVLD